MGKPCERGWFFQYEVPARVLFARSLSIRADPTILEPGTGYSTSCSYETKNRKAMQFQCITILLQLFHIENCRFT